MKFHVLTLFPEMIRQGLETSIIGRAMENNIIEVNAINIRDYTRDRHGKVDDYPYGGGAGMLMQAQPVFDAWQAVAAGKTRTVYVTPKGRPFTQKLAAELAKEEELIFLCGHYEGIDERVLEEIVTDSVSIGDYVLTGGELAAMVMIDAIARLVPGVLHNGTSAMSESFHNDLLEYPQYSRPEEWHGKKVPEVLLSGDHRKVEAWRLMQSERCTETARPDLYARYLRKQQLIKQLGRKKRNHIHMMECLARGTAEILYWDEGDVLLYDAESGCCMMTAVSAATGSRMTGLLPGESRRVVAAQEFLCAPVMEYLHWQKRRECVQFVYTEKVPLSTRQKDPAQEQEIGKINRLLEKGRTPFVQIPMDDPEGIALLESLGLYRADRTLWLLEP